MACQLLYQLRPLQLKQHYKIFLDCHFHSLLHAHKFLGFLNSSIFQLKFRSISQKIVLYACFKGTFEIGGAQTTIFNHLQT